MDRFETQFENLDVQSQVMEYTMMASSTLTTPQGEVDSLMSQAADEAGYVLSMGANNTRFHVEITLINFIQFSLFDCISITFSHRL